MLPVTVAMTPMLGEAEDDEPAAMTLHTGDLVFPGRDFPALAWHAPMEGGPSVRKGPMFEIRPTSGDGHGYGFKADFGAAVKVPTAAFVCGKLGLRAALVETCLRSLSRARTKGGAVVAWMIASSESTPIAVVRGGEVTTMIVDSIGSGRLIEVGATTLLLVTTRTASSDGKLTAGKLVPIRVEGGKVARLRPITIDEIDNRDGVNVISRVAKLEIVDGVAVVTGVRKIVKLADGAEVASTPIAERFVLVEQPVLP